MKNLDEKTKINVPKELKEGPIYDPKDSTLAKSFSEEASPNEILEDSLGLEENKNYLSEEKIKPRKCVSRHLLATGVFLYSMLLPLGMNNSVSSGPTESNRNFYEKPADFSKFLDRDFEDYYSLEKKVSEKSNKSVEIKDPYWSKKGRFQRVYRWDDEIDSIAEKYGIPQGILQAIAMHESYGIQDITNGSGDAGIFQMQSGITKFYGGSVFKDANHIGNVDSSYIKEFNEWKDTTNKENLKRKDKRFDPVFSADVAAQLLSDLYEGDWKKAIVEYHAGPIKDEDTSKYSYYINGVESMYSTYTKNDPDKGNYKPSEEIFKN